MLDRLTRGYEEAGVQAEVLNFARVWTQAGAPPPKPLEGFFVHAQKAGVSRGFWKVFCACAGKYSGL